MDATFELVDGLWLTDSTFIHEGLVVAGTGKHPEFPGPSLWHFRKDRQTYRRFAVEMVMGDPGLINIKKIGHDLDRTIPNSLTDVFKDAQKFWCTEHMQKRDRLKLQNMGYGQRNSDRIMADIYGCQNDVLLQTGLADAINEDDFMAKYESLGQIWDNLVPGFHRWFKRKRAPLFIESAILSARENAGIEGRFYTNGLELKDRFKTK